MHLNPVLPFSDSANVLFFGITLIGFLMFIIAIVGEAPAMTIFALPLILVGIFFGMNGYQSNNAAWHEALQTQAAKHYGVKLTPEQSSELFTENFLLDNHGAQVQGSTAVRVQGKVREITLFHVGDEWVLGTGQNPANVHELTAVAR